MPSVTEQPLPGSCHGLAPRQEGTGTYRLCIRLTQKQQSESSGFKYGVKCAEEGALSTHTGGGKSWELSGGQAGRQAVSYTRSLLSSSTLSKMKTCGLPMQSCPDPWHRLSLKGSVSPGACSILSQNFICNSHKMKPTLGKCTFFFLFSLVVTIPTITSRSLTFTLWQQTLRTTSGQSQAFLTKPTLGIRPPLFHQQGHLDAPRSGITELESVSGLS